MPIEAVRISIVVGMLMGLSNRNESGALDAANHSPLLPREKQFDYTIYIRDSKAVALVFIVFSYSHCALV